jgi:hypothetical protein
MRLYVCVQNENNMQQIEEEQRDLSKFYVFIENRGNLFNVIVSKTKPIVN